MISRETRLDTRLAKSRAGGQGAVFEVTRPFGQEQRGKRIKNRKVESCSTRLKSHKHVSFDQHIYDIENIGKKR